MDLANGSTFGRGTMTFGGLSFIFYIVDSTRFKLMENDGQFATFGDALQQSATVATQNSGFTGDFTFLIGGPPVLATAGPAARAAAFPPHPRPPVGGHLLAPNNTPPPHSLPG